MYSTPRPLFRCLPNSRRLPRYFSSARTKNEEKEAWHRPRIGLAVVVAGATTAAFLVVSSYQTRRWRKDRIQELPLVTGVWDEYYPSRSLPSVVQIMERAGLMGTSHSVKAELEDIRKWHREHDFRGGLVLRDLTKPLFGIDEDDPHHEESELSLFEILQDPTRLARRECYYLYYELKPNGESQQQIFCRGTTLSADILTCLEAWMVYDEELECRVHRGFRNQADRILRDVIPLLSPPAHRRATIEVCGHSLGGAVATIVAAKLRRRGYRVVRLTTVAEPRLCATRRDANKLCELLPADQLRVECDLDFVPFLPPFGSPTGNKIWITKDSIRFARRGVSWPDSVWRNFNAFEILASGGQPHRIRNHVKSLRRITNTVREISS